MTAHLFFVPAGALDVHSAGTHLVLGGDEGRHAATVKRIRVGEEILLSDGAGCLATGTVTDVGRGELGIAVSDVSTLPEPQLRFTLVQALAKGDRDLQALEAATELGIDAIVPWQAERSIVQWKGERAAKAHKKWVAQALAATKQSRQARVPQVHDLVNKAGLVEAIEAADLALLLHEDAQASIASAPLPETGNVLLIVGPEGGMSDGEVEQFVAAGAVLTKLGETVLRSSSAGPAALAALLVRTRWTTPT